jgi:hypothetical protein
MLNLYVLEAKILDRFRNSTYGVKPSILSVNFPESQTHRFSSSAKTSNNLSII